MNKNREKYQRSFNALHLSDDFREQIKSIPEDNGKGKIMKFRSVYGISRVAAAVATVCTLALGSAGACFACDVGCGVSRSGYSPMTYSPYDNTIKRRDHTPLKDDVDYYEYISK